MVCVKKSMENKLSSPSVTRASAWLSSVLGRLRVEFAMSIAGLPRVMLTMMSMVTQPCHTRLLISHSATSKAPFSLSSSTCKPNPCASRQANPIEVQHLLGQFVDWKYCVNSRSVCTRAILPLSNRSSLKRSLDLDRHKEERRSFSSSGRSENCMPSARAALKAQWKTIDDGPDFFDAPSPNPGLVRR